MDAILKIYNAIPYFIFNIMDVLVRVSAVLFVYFSTKYRNGKHRALYYVLAVLTPLIGVIVFAVKRKEMTGAGMKKCPSCGSLYPPEFSYCYKCNIELPPYDQKKNNAQKTLALVMVILFGICEVISIIPIPLTVAGAAKEFFGIVSGVEDYGPISFTDENGNEVWYDRNGDAYTHPDEVPLFTSDGKKYVYSNALDRLACSSDNKTMDYYDAYVDMDGYLVTDKSIDIYFNPKYGKDYSEEETTKSEFDKYLDKITSADADGYDEVGDIDFASIEMYKHPYYENPFSDDDGNLYFEASVASWNKDGKLITSEKDIVG